MLESSRPTLWLAAVLVLLCGCYKATFYQSDDAIPGERHEEWTDFFIFGLVGTERFDVHQFCPDGDVAEIKTGGNFATGLVSTLTIGIYTPHKVYVTCAARSGQARGAARRLELSLDAHGAPVRARVRVAGHAHPARVEPAGDHAFRVHVDGEAAL